MRMRVRWPLHSQFSGAETEFRAGLGNIPQDPATTPNAIAEQVTSGGVEGDGYRAPHGSHYHAMGIACRMVEDDAVIMARNRQGSPIARPGHIAYQGRQTINSRHPLAIEIDDPHTIGA